MYEDLHYSFTKDFRQYNGQRITAKKSIQDITTKIKIKIHSSDLFQSSATIREGNMIESTDHFSLLPLKMLGSNLIIEPKSTSVVLNNSGYIPVLTS